MEATYVGSVRFILAIASILVFAIVLPTSDASPKRIKKDVNAELHKTIRDGWKVEPPKPTSTAVSFVEQKAKLCIVRTTAGSECAKDVSRFIDIYLHFFRKIFNKPFKIRGALKVRVFAHYEEFLEYYQKIYPGSDRTPRKALYSPSQKETWVVLQGNVAMRTLPLETTKHELTHHLLHFFTGHASLPPWFTEGVACFFQYWDISESMKTNIAKNLDRATQGDYSYFPRVVKKAFGTSNFVPPGELLKLSYETFHTEDKDRERLHYSESWALVNFLTTTKKGQRFFNSIVQTLRDGKKIEKALHPKTIAALEKVWYRDIETRLLKLTRN